MGALPSQDGSLLTLHTLVTQDMGDLLGVATERDIITMMKRSAAEGDSFFTITLPLFEEGLLRALTLERADPTMWPGFRSRGCLPVFLRGFTDLIFSADGLIRLDADEEAIRAVRQICCFSKKLERAVAPSRLRAAERQYIQTDADAVSAIDPFWLRELKRTFSALFRDVLASLETAISNFDLVPRHGPGSVVDLKGQRMKWEDMRWFDSIDHVFPHRFYFSSNFRGELRPGYEPGQEPPVKVIFVPKTMKSPRVIAIEPACRQYVQQAVARRLYRLLRRAYPASLDLFDQRTNQAYAWLGSLDGSVATLDLSEASDRLSAALVFELIREFPHVSEAFTAARSPEAVTPDGSLVRLNKFASMGSALTFPVQSMVFYAIAVLGSGANPRGAKKLPISVFGDDIIVPVTATPAVSRLLEIFGLRVNRTKSFSTGEFRESCGGDFFRGFDVTYVKLRRDLPSSTRHAEQIVSTVALRNLVYVRGMWRTARFLDQALSRLIDWKRPAPVDHPSLSRWTFCPVPPDRWNRSLHRDEIRRPAVSPVGRSAEPEGYAGLVKWLVGAASRSDEPLSSFGATERSTALAIHSRWHVL